jgi:ATP adenylyltransferase
MDILWAPWRIKYIKAKRGKYCLFCRVAKKKDKKDFVFLRSKYFFSMLNLYPYNNGHTMISPYRHIQNTSSLKREEALDLIFILNKTISLLNKVLKPEGYNIGMNLGSVSGAGITGHLHIHIVPRWKGDTNFMPLISDSKVISQSLNELYRRLTKC